MLPSLINLPDHMKDAEVRLTNNRNSTDYLAKQLNSTNRGLREILGQLEGLEWLAKSLTIRKETMAIQTDAASVGLATAVAMDVEIGDASAMADGENFMAMANKKNDLAMTSIHGHCLITFHTTW